MADARVYPPSEQRLVEARRQGHVPHTTLVSFAGAFVAFALWAPRAAPQLSTEVAELWRAALARAAEGRPLAAGTLLSEMLSSVLGTLSLGLAMMLAAMVLALWLVQGVAWGLIVRSPRPRFERPRRDATAPLLLVSCALVVLGVTLFATFRLELVTLSEGLERWLLASSVCLVACAFVDAAFARARHMRSLWLTRREHLDELREAYGSLELRSERQRRSRMSGPER